MQLRTANFPRLVFIAIFFCTLVFFALIPHITYGADGFVPLAEFQDSAKLSNLYAEGDPGDLVTYINKLFFFAVSLGALLAVLRLTWAGYLYMSTDAFGKKEHAKEVIRDTVLGLLLLLSVYLILHQINPNILSLKVNMSALPSNPSTNTQGAVQSPPAITNTTTTYVDSKTNYTVTGVPTLTYPSDPKTAEDAKAIQDARDTFAKQCSSNGPGYEIKTGGGMDQCVLILPPVVIGPKVVPSEQIPQADCKTNGFGFTRCTRDNFNFPAFGETNPICGTLSKNGDFICGFSDIEQCGATLIDVGFFLDGCRPLRS